MPHQTAATHIGGRKAHACRQPAGARSLGVFCSQSSLTWMGKECMRTSRPSTALQPHPAPCMTLVCDTCAVQEPCGVLGEMMGRTFLACEPGAEGSMCLFRGLRVRMGVHTMGANQADGQIAFNKNSGRVNYSGGWAGRYRGAVQPCTLLGGWAVQYGGAVQPCTVLWWSGAGQYCTVPHGTIWGGACDCHVLYHIVLLYRTVCTIQHCNVMCNHLPISISVRVGWTLVQ